MGTGDLVVKWHYEKYLRESMSRRIQRYHALPAPPHIQGLHGLTFSLAQFKLYLSDITMVDH